MHSCSIVQYWLPLCAVIAASVPLYAGLTLSPLATFGGTDGWRAPGEIVVGDAAGSNNGVTYTFLGTGGLERGLAYCPQYEKLVLVSRNGGNNVRLLDPVTGADLGPMSLGTGVIDTGSSGGTFKVSTVACDENGAVYVANLTTAGTNVKVYRWEEPTSEPVLYFDAPLTDYSPTPRFGDNFDVFYRAAGSVLLLGGGANTPGYLLGEAGVATKVTSFAPALPSATPFRLGVTFGPGGENDVWGRNNAGTSAVRTTWTAGASAGVYDGAAALTAVAEVGMDYAVIGSNKLLATCEFNNSTSLVPRVRIYDVQNPAAPSLLASGTTAVTPLTTNGNGVGSIKWGEVTENAGVFTAQLYAMSTNQGIQAFDVTITPDAVPPAIVDSPASRSVFARGQTTFTVSASGTPPLSYQWLKGGEIITGATSASYTINPVTEASAGDYTCRVSNAALPPAESIAATLTVEPGMDTGALTQLWQLKTGDRLFLTGGDFQRGLAANPAGSKLYVANRSSAVSVHVLNAGTGDDAGTLDVSGIAGGQFALNMLGCAADGTIYGCNLTGNDGVGFKLYEWPDDQPATPPALVYDGTPAAAHRTGDSLDVRGSGAELQIVAGTNIAPTSTHFVLFTKTEIGFLEPHAINVPGAADRAFSLGIGFGPDNTIWGKGSGTGITIARLTYDAMAVPPWSAALVSVIPVPAIPSSGGAIAVDAANGCLAHIHTGNSDNVRLYRLPALDPAPVALEWLDQEFYLTDSTNGNATGQAVFAGGRLFSLNTNNGMAAYSIAKPLPPAPDPVITDVTQSGGSVAFKLKGVMGRTYVIEKSTQLDPIATWSADGTVTQDEVEETVVRAIPPNTPRLYYRAREQTNIAAQ
jgi:hypothetical protein